jgi:hypothetical protein
LGRCRSRHVWNSRFDRCLCVHRETQLRAFLGLTGSWINRVGVCGSGAWRFGLVDGAHVFGESV